MVYWKSFVFNLKNIWKNSRVVRHQYQVDKTILTVCEVLKRVQGLSPKIRLVLNKSIKVFFECACVCEIVCVQ